MTEHFNTVMIDPGHGGSASGAAYDFPGLDYDGLKEKDFSLAVGLYLGLMLTSKQVAARMTRADDSFVSLKTRVSMSGSVEADCFVSIHADAFPESPVEGFTVYHNPAGQDLARHISQSISAAFPDERNRGVRPQTFYVLRNNEIPAVLVECGFVSTTTQRLWLMQPHIQYRYALAIMQGINLFFDNGV